MTQKQTKKLEQSLNDIGLSIEGQEYGGLMLLAVLLRNQLNKEIDQQAMRVGEFDTNIASIGALSLAYATIVNAVGGDK